MATRAVAVGPCPEIAVGNMVAEVLTALDSIRSRAYELAARRGFAAGRELDDWLAAENELFFVPPACLQESAAGYILTVPAAGFNPERIVVSVEPRCVTIWGKSLTSREAPAAEAGVDRREMFCRYRLPQAVVAEAATATCAAGQLTVNLPRLREPLEADLERPAGA